MAEHTPPNGIMWIPATPVALERRKESHVVGWTVVLSSMFWPRLFILGFWIFSDLLGDAYSSSALPIVGFFIAPWTTFGYAMMWGISSDTVSGWEWSVVALCILADLATAFGAWRLARS